MRHALTRKPPTGSANVTLDLQEMEQTATVKSFEYILLLQNNFRSINAYKKIKPITSLMF